MITDETVDIVYMMLDGKTYNKQNMRIALEAGLSALSVEPQTVQINVDALAQEIRRVDGKHDKGAAALAEALMPFLSALSISPAPVDGGEPTPRNPSPSTHVAGSADSLVSAVFNELGEAEYKLARWNPASDPWHYWSREAIENAIRSVVATHSMDGSRSLPFDRDTLGRFVREAWVRWAETQPEPKSSWLVPYDELSEPDKEADRQIGEAVARWTLIGDAADTALATEGK